ncbi:MAG: alpha/beta hydrolase [Spirosoma sp.]|nr:alpha/beta hydrolase [Spirosoma sp.]
MTRFLLLLALLLSLVSIATLAQTEEPMHYAITQPANVSLTLDGTLTLPANLTKPVPVVLLIAGSGPTDRDCNSALGLKSNAFKMLADSLNRMGIAVARYDKRYSGTNLMAAAKAIPVEKHRFDFYVADAVGFVRQLQADKRFSKVVVAGHSEGSLVGMLATEQTKAAKYISIAGAGRNIVDVMKEQGRTGGNPAKLQEEVDAALDSMRTGHTVQPRNPILRTQLSEKNQPYLISWMKYDPAVEIKKLTVPVLLINGKHDFQVPVSEAERLKTARPDAKLVLFDTMNHILKNAPEGRAENMKTYNDPTLPLTPGLATAIAEFAKR